MSIVKTIGEYLNAVKTGIQNGDKIIEALAVSAQIKNGEINDEAMAEILKRKDLCAVCPHNSANAKKDGSYVSGLPFEHCTLCKCRIGYDDSKEYCLSCTCGAKDWNEKHPNPAHQIEVKWTAFDINKKETN